MSCFTGWRELLRENTKNDPEAGEFERRLVVGLWCLLLPMVLVLDLLALPFYALGWLVLRKGRRIDADL